MALDPDRLPVIIQGGMGAAVSDWRLARAVAEQHQMGVVSGTGLDTVLVRRLQLGDEGGHVRRALSHLPHPGAAGAILDRYFIPGGKPAGKPFKLKPLPSLRPTVEAQWLLVAANFVEVFLARPRCGGPIGINYLEKIQAPLAASLYGAMLAGVDCVLVGAGIPRSVPGLIDRLAQHEPVEHRLDVEGAPADHNFVVHFDPGELGIAAADRPTIRRPSFLPIVASHTLAVALARKSAGQIDGFVIEGHTAGGHNAPPRGRGAAPVGGGEPIYGERDLPDLGAVRELGLPFWLAGGYAGPGMLSRALSEGARGVQVGTAFAYCDESGLRADLKRDVLARSRGGLAKVRTDPVASPTGFPFKVVNLPGTLSERAVYAERDRACDLGYLRTAYQRADGSLGWRCPAEPIDRYHRKGGGETDSDGRMCLCNALMACIGLAQVRPDGYTEPPVLTAGADVESIARLIPPGRDGYTAADVIDYLLAR